MENKNVYLSQTQESVDPIGIELLISILATSISIVSAIHQFGLYPKRDDKILKEFKRLRKQLLRIHNSLDDLILAVDRHDLSNEKIKSIEKKSLTLSDTLMELSPKDYYRWEDVRESIYELSQITFSVISNIRSLCSDLSDEGTLETLGNEVLSPFDDLLIHFSSYEFGKFVSEFRDALSKLDENLVKLIVEK